MKIAALINTFRNDESGAVTVDWVVLTAAIVGLGLAVMALVSRVSRTSAPRSTPTCRPSTPSSIRSTNTTEHERLVRPGPPRPVAFQTIHGA